MSNLKSLWLMIAIMVSTFKKLFLKIRFHFVIFFMKTLRHPDIQYNLDFNTA